MKKNNTSHKATVTNKHTKQELSYSNEYEPITKDNTQYYKTNHIKVNVYKRELN